MTAPESISALWHLPACTVIVRQSIMHVTVIVSSMNGPPCSWGALLREGSFSLNHLQSHWRCHPSCNTLIVGHQS